jgi:hypothetical protein
VRESPPVSLTVAYDLWLESWESELVALATATESRTLSTIEVAAHKAVIAAERELVTQQFTVLLGPASAHAGCSPTQGRRPWIPSQSTVRIRSDSSTVKTRPKRRMDRGW